MLLDDQAKEVFRKQLRYMADFCGVEVITYCVMSNHFHVLVRIPDKQDISDDELIRRYKLLYGHRVDLVTLFEQNIRSGGSLAESKRKQLLARMGDVSIFMKELKQRFTIWYNKSHGRYGTFWAERFKSALVENKEGALRTVAAYIDLNPVRAGMVEDPSEYRWCGYAEAMGGSSLAKAGLASISFGKSFEAVLPAYRLLLFGYGQTKSKNKDVTIDVEKAKKVLESGGQLPLHVLLRLRIRYFSDGAVLGTEAFVREWIQTYWPPGLEGEPSGRRTGPRRLKGFDRENPLRSLRALRKQVIA